MSGETSPLRPVAWAHVCLRAWYGAVEGLDDWTEVPVAVAALSRFLDREGLLGMLCAAEERRRQAKRTGRPSAPVFRLLTGDLRARLDAVFPSKAAFVAAGGGRP